MGDRGNIVVRQEKDTNRGDVWFYTHWSGSDIEEVARKALARQQRWEDPSYLARIVFDALTEGQQGKETGFGISTQVGDNEYPILVIDAPNKAVYLIDEAKLIDGRLPDSTAKGYFTGSHRKKGWTFEQFIEPAPIKA